jgi:hypothetical protein
LPVIVYADDVFKGLNCVDPQQIRSILQVYVDFATVSGLKISLDKTATLAINTDPNLLREITEMTGIKVVTEMKSLRIELHSTVGGNVIVRTKIIARGTSGDDIIHLKTSYIKFKVIL